MKTKLINSISKMIPVGKRLELPTDEQFSNYAQVKKALLTAGGKYKRCGFVFSDDAKTVQSRLVSGEVINDKKKYQFFATPPALAQQLIEMANIQKNHLCLEPSAGQGALSDLVLKITGKCVVVELMPECIKVLSRKGYQPKKGDFLKIGVGDLGLFDRIVANPPFTRNQDIDHIRHMYSLLTFDGKLVSIASKSWLLGSQKKQIVFQKWLVEIGAVITEIPTGAFKESGTNISSVIIEINKRTKYGLYSDNQRQTLEDSDRS